ncbi:hypothetical protein A2U01_0084739 [Trifolium medium]|uniref:Uncharacterized protein n=1 Tax=Trifolium medium TaxID=97028 RepID=A0A392TR66_9FABA|nr:hypothetical protein [Trifolium medium]
MQKNHAASSPITNHQSPPLPHFSIVAVANNESSRRRRRRRSPGWRLVYIWLSFALFPS